MKIWILNVGENMPTDSNSPRLLRCGILANLLSKSGHDVIWWSSTFDHYLKKHRYIKDTDVYIEPNYKIKFLFGKGYNSNVSINRILDHHILGEKFYLNAIKEEKPDVIISSWPIISLSYKAVKYAFKNNIPIVVDVRDMWPDIFINEFPRSLQWLAKLLLKPVFVKTNFVFKNATSITGMTNSFVEWGLTKASRSKNTNDIAFPFAYKRNLDNNENPENEDEFLKLHNIDRDKVNIAVVSYIGSVIDIDFIIECAKKLSLSKINSDIIICGDGVLFEEFKKRAESFDNIKLLGWCNAHEILVVMKCSGAGLIPYKNRIDFNMSIPNKVPEYLSAGLPVISTLKGEVKSLVEKNNCGYFVETADAFVEIVGNIHTNPDLHEKMNQNAFECFKVNFDSDVVYNNMCDYLEKIALNC